MINFTEKFFDLKLLKISNIKLHETTETKRLRNIYDRIANDRFLFNPVIVGLHGNDLILIDGANRLSTLRDIGCKLSIAQVIDYDNKKIKLKNWNHLVYNIDLDSFIKYFDKNKIKYRFVKYSEGSKIRNSKLYYMLISNINSDETILAYLPKSFQDVVTELNKLTKLYFGKYPFDRSEEEIRYQDLRKYTRKKGILIEFPKFKKHHVINAAKNGYKIPAGITRHILINRVLHVMYEISKLKNDKNIEEKTKELEKYLINKIDNNKVRQYRESVIVFDE
ncbi:MAG: hypothetical protein JW917_10250 [Ignavibacteria bacterium]|nr:hypothetical protein [Ignavibacteria bacterium]